MLDPVKKVVTMTKKNRRKVRPRLSGRNAIAVLNSLLRIVNPHLKAGENLNPVKTPEDLSSLNATLKRITTIRVDESPRSETANPKPHSVPSSVVRALSVIATNAWRTRIKMVDPDSGETKDEMKRVIRHIDSIFETLSEIGIELRDSRGRAYDSGMAIKVVSFEPTPGLAREEITETIKPTIAWQGQIIQMGEVIVGTPQTG